MKNKLYEEFKDKEYAHVYMDSYLIDRISTQIYQLRIQRGWTQQQLSELSGIAQERISLLESGDFSSITMKTLKKLASAFDVAISIKFESFAEMIEDFIDLSETTLRVDSRPESLMKAKAATNAYSNWFNHLKKPTLVNDSPATQAANSPTYNVTSLKIASSY